jgi:MFS family permease
MNAPRILSGPRAVTVLGLVVGALGIAILWASGVEFPIYPPPGIVILLAGAVLVGLVSWRWAPGVGAFLGLFVLVGFLISPTGRSNLLGEAGAAVAIGQAIQVLGVLTALIAGVIATRANDHKQVRPSQ